MRQNLFKLSKVKIYINLIILLMFSFLILFFSHTAEFDMEGYVMNATYLHIENYILMVISILIIVYYLVCQIYTFFKEKNKYYLSMSIINILLLFGLSPYILGQTFYSDLIGLHIDKFIGLLFLMFSIINLIVLSLIFLIMHFVKNRKNFWVK